MIGKNYIKLSINNVNKKKTNLTENEVPLYRKNDNEDRRHNFSVHSGDLWDD